MEFKRYFDFLSNESLTEFKTYLPVQLDATCNSFQHLSLLSEQSKLYKKLNLINGNSKNQTKSRDPEDLYSLIILKSEQKFDEIINDSNSETTLKDSCKRLKGLLLDRKIIKKGIMTIPYNSTDYRIIEGMRKALLGSKQVYVEDDDNEGKIKATT